jgi:hypothetical protein
VAALGGEILRDLIVGGGSARDPLASEIPVVLQRDIYAVVALGGPVARRSCPGWAWRCRFRWASRRA